MIPTKQLWALAATLCLALGLDAQTTYYWIGSGSSWATASNWSLASGGSASTVAPGASDIAVFDANGGDCTLAANATVGEVVMEDDYANTLDLDGHSLTVAGGFTQHAGTFQGGSAAVGIGGTLHLIGGEYHATTGTTTVGADIIEEGEYLYPQGGKFLLTGTGATIDIASFFYDLEIGTGASAELGNGIAVAHNLHLGGPLNAGEHTVFIGSSSATAITGGSGIYLALGAEAYGIVYWGIGEGTGTYTVPMLATPTGPVIPVAMDVTTAGAAGTGPYDGFVMFLCIELDSTKPQDMLPNGGYYNATGGNNADMNINRLWGLVLSGYGESPVFDLELAYADADLTGIAATEANLRGQVHDEKHWTGTMGTPDATANTLALTDLSLPTDGRASFVTLVDNTSPNRNNYGGNVGLTCTDAVNAFNLSENTAYTGFDSIFWVKFTYEGQPELIVLHADSIGLLNFYSVYSSCSGSALYSLDSSSFRSEVILLDSTFQMDSVYFLKIDVRHASREFKLLLSDCGNRALPEPEEFCDCDWASSVLNDLSRFTPDANTPVITLRAYPVFFRDDNGERGFDPTNADHTKAFNDAFGNPDGSGPWNSFNYRLAHLTNPSTSGSCYNGHISDSKIRFQWEPLYLNSTALLDDNNTTLCPDFSGYAYHTLTNLINGYSEPGFMLYFSGTIDLIDALQDPDYQFGDPLPPGKNWSPPAPFGANACANFPTCDHSVHMQTHYSNRFASYLYNPYVPFEFPGTFWDNINRAGASGNNWNENVYNWLINTWGSGLAHELGHNLGLTHPGFSNCINNFMVMSDNGNGRNYLTVPQLGLVHKNLCTTVLREYVVGCPYNAANQFIVTGNDLIDFDFTWYGDIVVKPGGILTITCTVRMPDNAKIIIEPGGKLIIDGGKVTSFCEGLWAGIEVWGNSSKEHPKAGLIEAGVYPSANYANEQGVVYIKNGGVIENAVVGVTAAKRWLGQRVYSGYNGGIIIAEGSTFRNNRKHIEMFPFVDPAPTRPVFNACKFTACTFEIDGALNGNASLLDGFVTLRDVHGVTFIEDTFVNKTPSLYSSNRGVGIMSIDATFKIQSTNCINYLSGDCAPYGYRPNLFQDLRVGIDAKGSKSFPYSPPVITRAKFDGCMQGVTLQGTSYVQVYANNFVFDAPLKNTGLYLYQNRNHMVAENRFDLGDVYQARGIYNANSWKLNAHQQYRNIFLNGGTKDEAIGNSGSNSRVTFKCNDFQDPMDHFLLYSGSIALNQGEMKNPAGNIFELSCNTTTQTHFWFNSTSPTGSVNYFHHLSPTDRIPKLTCLNQIKVLNINTLIPNDTSWCKAKYTSISGSTGGGGGFGGKVAENDSLRSLIDSVYVHLDGGNTWGLIAAIRNVSGVADTIILESLNGLAGELSDKVIMELMGNRPSIDRTGLGTVLMENYPYAAEMLDIFNELNPPLSSSVWDSIYKYQDSSSARKIWTDSLWHYNYRRDLNYQDMMYELALDTNITLGDIIAELESETEPGLLLMLADLYVADSQFSNAGLVYDTIPIYQNETRQWVNLRQIEEQFRGQGWDWTYIDSTGESAGFEDDIRDIAATNTVAGVQALNILDMVLGETYELPWEDKEDTSSKWGMDEAPSNFSAIAEEFNVYPNPTSHTLTIEYPLNEDSEGTFEVYSLLGERLVSIQLPVKQTIFVLNTTGYSQGTYFYRIMTEGKLQKTGKVVILR